MPTASARSRFLKQAVAICAGTAFGVVCFFAGRYSVYPPASGAATTAANSTVVMPANTAGTTNQAPVTSAGGTDGAAASKPSTKWDEQQWNELMSRPGTVARNAALADLLEKLAITDPKRAMALAQATGNLKLRADLQQATLRGWARSAPADAAKWGLDLPNQSDRSAAISTVFASAVATNPDEAIRVAKLVMEQEPGGDIGYGSSLIDSLCNAGNFEAAAKFAAEGGDSQRSFWLGETYSKWAELQPDQAAAAAAAITDPDLRSQALHGIVGGWSEADPVALTRFLAQLPPGSDRRSMLGQALQNWVRLDPEAAANWINNSDLGADLDEGAKAVATMDMFAGDITPTVAVNWAESINDETVRSEALANLLHDWALIDLSAAKNYFESSTNLLPADREQIGKMLTELSGNSAE